MSEMSIRLRERADWLASRSIDGTIELQAATEIELLLEALRKAYEAAELVLQPRGELDD